MSLPHARRSLWTIRNTRGETVGYELGWNELDAIETYLARFGYQQRAFRPKRHELRAELRVSA